MNIRPSNYRSWLRHCLRLKNENNNLSERINNLTYILADLQGKTKNAEEERDSLITAMRLLVAESNTAIEKSQSPKQNTEIEQSGPNGADECTTQEQMKDTLIPNIRISNRFSGLDTDQNYTEDSKTASQGIPETTSKKRKRKCKSKRKETISNSEEHQPDVSTEEQTTQNDHQRQQSKASMNLHKTNDETSKMKRNTVIVGDSIIKYVKGWELSDATERVTVKSFSGASVQDIRDFIKQYFAKILIN